MYIQIGWGYSKNNRYFVKKLGLRGVKIFQNSVHVVLTQPQWSSKNKYIYSFLIREKPFLVISFFAQLFLYILYEIIYIDELLGLMLFVHCNVHRAIVFELVDILCTSRV